MTSGKNVVRLFEFENKDSNSNVDLVNVNLFEDYDSSDMFIQVESRGPEINNIWTELERVRITNSLESAKVIAESLSGTVIDLLKLGYTIRS